MNQLTFSKRYLYNTQLIDLGFRFAILLFHLQIFYNIFKDIVFTDKKPIFL